MATATTKGFERSEKTRLGITAKSTAPLVAEKLQENRRNRFKYQAVGSKILAKDATKKLQKMRHKKYVGDIHRTCDCAWSVVASHVSVKKSPEFKTAHYKGLATCGSVWACPVCTAKIQERRRIEIADAMNQHYDQGGQVMMVTLTAPHYNHQSLEELREMQREALSSFRNGSGAFKRMLDDQGYIGLIRSLEVTVSQRNGWHLHTHELWFVDKGADIERIEKRTLERWEKACLKSGLLNPFDTKQVKAFRKHSVDIKGAVSCSEYLAKMDDQQHWGADREIAKSSTKKGKKKGLHPFGLLAEVEEQTDKAVWAEKRFLEYCLTMKGSRQLFWSHGLKKHFGIGEKTDEELAVMEESELIDVIQIDIPTWKVIRKNGARSTVLEIAELDDKRALELFINVQKGQIEKPPIESVQPLLL